MNEANPEPLSPGGDSAHTTARRRSRRRFVLPSSSGEQAAFLNDLARRVTPSFDFFLFTLLAGLALLAALLIDSPALFVLAALLAPFMAPVVGLSFATILGSARFVIRMLGALVIATAVIFAWGALAGWLTHFLPPASYRYAAFHGSTSWPDLLLLVLGAALTSLALVRSPQQRPLVTSVAMAYELYLPAGAAGFSLTAGVGSAWPDGALVFLLHLSLAALTGALVLTLLGLRPLNAGGYLFGALLGLVALAGIVWVNASALQPFLTFPLPAAISAPTNTTSPLPVMETVTAGTATPPATPTITLTTTPSPTRTPTNTLVPTNTPTTTITPAPTAAYAFIAASQGGGALIRRNPGFQEPLVKTLLNGILVEVLPETIEKENVTWVKIRTPNGEIEGWIVRSLLTTSTPAPGG